MRAAFLLFGLLTACSEHKHDEAHGHSSKYPSCDAIIKACHPLDVGDGPIHDCHDFAHAESATEEACAARKADCLRICVPSDAGTDASDAAKD
jgi:hypothetical protein